MWRSAIEYKAAYTVDIAWWLNFKLSKGNRVTRQLWTGTKQHKPRRALLLVTERQGVFFRRTGGPTYPISTTALWTAFFWLMDCPAWYSQKTPDPTDLKRMNQFYTWCRSPAFYCVCSMLFAPLRVAFSYCIGWDIGGALICFWCSFSPGNSYWAEGLVWRWNTPGPSPYDRVERHCRPSLLYETGSLGCHETLGLTIW